MRTIVDLPKEQIKALDHYGEAHGVSRAEVMREAVAAYLPTPAQKKRFDKHPAFGSLKKKIDSVEYVRKLRAEWDR
jgi:metal-responsive CopG/Arc/MetJ family transcriptional regulator